MWFKFLIAFYIFVNTKSFTPQASYYNDSFNGRYTASGAIFSNDQMTAASPTLPFNSLVKVTNLENNKSVIVVINDRGPYKVDSTGKYQPHPIRHLDLSKRAFSEIADPQVGVIKVKYVILNKD